MPKRSAKKCGPGEIMREGFRKKGHKRNSYTRGDGTRVNASEVSETYVEPTCIKDRGKPGKGPKTLPVPGDIIKLSKYGYRIHKSDRVRQRALREASKDFDVLPVLRRLNLLRNLQAITSDSKEIFNEDVEYMKKLYARTKRREQMEQRGGNDPFTLDDTSSEISDRVIDKITLPERREIEIRKMENRKEICDDQGNCTVEGSIRESHTVDGKKVVYRTLTAKDTDQILKLDQICVDSSTGKKSIEDKIKSNPGLIIGIEVNDVLQGYCIYRSKDSKKVNIISFCANKGCCTPLYIFMERYFKTFGYNKINVVLEQGSITTKLCDTRFWENKGFIKNNDNVLEKFI